jgi:ABC-type Mn2+/Zn2+ transport system ATPase subunit
MIELENIVHCYEGEKEVLSSVSFSFEMGQSIGVLGPNGAGKSTLLKVMLGLEKAMSGKVLYDGKSIQEMHGKIAYIPQSFSIDTQFPITASQVIEMGFTVENGWFKRVSREQRQRALAVLKELELMDLKDRQIGELSGGQRQRVFLARALVQKAELYFFDEPFAALDEKSEEIIVKQMRHLTDDNKTLIVIHHDLLNSKEYFDALLFLNKRAVAFGPSDEVFTRQVINNTFYNTALFDEVMRLSQQKGVGAL